MAFKTSILAKSAGILMLAAVIGLSTVAGASESTTASVVEALKLPPSETAPAATQRPDANPIAAQPAEAKSTGTTITIVDSGLSILATVQAGTVGDALNELNIVLSDADAVTPAQSEPIANGGTLLIERARKLVLNVDDEKREVASRAKTIEALLGEAGVELGENDRVEPALDASLPETGAITVIRVTKETETEDEAIPFDSETTEDDSMNKGESVTDVAGQDGTKRLTYEVTFENGEEIDRELVSTETIEEPVTKKIRKGTYVAPPPPEPVAPSNPSGSVETGRATYYWGPTLAASTTLPKGTRVRVTNTNTGLSLDVTIDDTGGFTYPTVIDLRSDLFESLGATLSAGIMPVTVEVLQ